MTDWKENIREKMSGYSEPAPEGLLEEILAAADKDRRRQRNAIVLLSSMAAAAVLAAVAVFMPDEEYGTYSPDASGIVLSDSPEVIRIDRIPPASEMKDFPRPDRNIVLTDNDIAAGNSDALTGNDNDYDRDGAIAAGGYDALAGNTSVDDKNIVRQDSKKNESVDGNEESFSDGGYGWKDILLAEAGREKRKGRPVFGVYASGFSGGATRHSGYSQAVNTVAAAAPMSYGDNPLAGIMMFNRSKEVGTESRHYLPLKVGVSVSYALTPRWSLESGLTYSWLLSKSKTGSESYYVDSRQTLHYLGIPLNVNFHIWQNSRLDIYASAGGMLEKCVGGTVRSDYVYGGDVRESDRENLTVKPLQWSVGASAGLQFRLSDVVGLYLEPGVTYHFGNGSGVESAYSVHPLNFNLNLGLRFSLK